MSYLDKLRRIKLRGSKKFYFTFKDMAEIRGVSIYAVYKARERGDFIKGDIESMMRWSLKCRE